LVSIPDVFVLIGGSWGTLTEVSTIMKRNNTLVNRGVSLTPIIAISGSGELVDNLEQIANLFPPINGAHLKVNNSVELSEILTQNLQ
jgi:predicted Rossmann-fold nucleotide-binding protein